MSSTLDAVSGRCQYDLASEKSSAELLPSLQSSEKMTRSGIHRSVSCQHIQDFKHHRTDERTGGKTVIYRRALK